ncbi:hypothetical protein CKH36_18295 [Salmonella enterica]|nr:hypothetical protein [Salmonella enterica]
MNDLLVERVSAFVKSPLDNPLTRGEQMEVFKQLPDLPITDGHVQQVINSHEKGWAMIVPCKITYELAKEVQANRARSKEE